MQPGTESLGWIFIIFSQALKTRIVSLKLNFKSAKVGETESNWFVLGGCCSSLEEQQPAMPLKQLRILPACLPVELALSGAPVPKPACPKASTVSTLGKEEPPSTESAWE